MTALPESEHERGYVEGQRRAVIDLLRHALKGLYGDNPKDPLVRVAELEAERLEMIATLRGAYRDLGIKDDWPDNMHLSDVIDNLVKHWPEEDEA